MISSDSVIMETNVTTPMQKYGFCVVMNVFS